jgi:hypothetical protein
MKIHLQKNETLLVLAIVLSLFYWIYLFFNTEAQIVYDSVQYVDLGRTIFREGWVAYFKEGAIREPVYPFIIATSMFLEDHFSVPYIHFQKSIQILFLFATQCLLLVAMGKMAIRPVVQAAVLLYAGLSPALVNSGFSIFSEIVTYPFMLVITLLGTSALMHGNNPSSGQMAMLGVGLGISFCILIATKAIFEYIFLLIVVFWTMLLCYHFLRKRILQAKNLLVVLAVSLVLVQSFQHTFKSLNQKYNENGSIRSGGAMLYGGVDKRLVPFSTSRLLAAVLHIPGDNICPKFLAITECRHWRYTTSDRLGIEKRDELLDKGVSEGEIDSTIIALSIKRILNQPIQYATFHIIESLRMLFWESTQIGFVNYPVWLNKLYNNSAVRLSLRLIVGLTTFSAIVFCFFEFIRERHKFANAPRAQAAYRLRMTFLNLFFVLIFAALHGFFTILTRYAFPIVPLYLLLIAVFLHTTIGRRHNISTC